MPVSQPYIDSIDPVLLANRPERIELWLPSAFPPSSLHAHCTDGLPELEYRLRCAQAADALHDVRNFRRLTRILAVKTQTHIANTQRTSTRTRTLFDKVKIKLSQAVSTYRTARKAIANLAPSEEFGPWKESLLELQNGDIRGPGTDESQPSNSRSVQSWIWTTAPQASASPEDPDLQVTLRIEWAKAQERAKRYEEEVELVVEEMRRTLSFLEWKAEEWLSFAASPTSGASAIDTVTVNGVTAYGKKQADIYRRMAKLFIDDWYHRLARLPFKVKWLKNYPRPLKIKRNRLVSNIRLYHNASYDPQTDPLEAVEETSDDEDVGGPRHTTNDYLEELIDSVQ